MSFTSIKTPFVHGNDCGVGGGCTGTDAKHPGYNPSYPRCSYNYPDYNYYASYPYRCIQDPFSYGIAYSRRNFVGPDYRDVYYTGENRVDPAEFQ
jgi:hypothetical protein